jgi:uncharacterized protein
MMLDLDRTPAGRSRLVVAGELALDVGAGGPQKVTVAGDLEVDNLERRFLVHGQLRATGAAECGRCLAEFTLHYDVPVEIVVLRDENDDEGEGDNLVLHQRAGEVDLSEALRESAVLAVPQAKICDPGCRGLCADCGADLNEGPCGCAAADVDPRWEGLPDD